MTDPELAALAELAERATPGPWEPDVIYVVGLVPGGRPSGEVILECRPTVSGLRTPDRANAAYIAAANPSAIKRLLSSHAAMRAENEKMRAVLRWYGENWRYSYDNDCCFEGVPPGKDPLRTRNYDSDQGVLADNGERAIAALSKHSPDAAKETDA